MVLTLPTFIRIVNEHLLNDSMKCVQPCRQTTKPMIDLIKNTSNQVGILSQIKAFDSEVHDKIKCLVKFDNLLKINKYIDSDHT